MMDNEQFGGRTDDDLFADDFEPAGLEDQAPAAIPVEEVQAQTRDVPVHVEPKGEAGEEVSAVEPPVAPLQAQPHKYLSQSRHNRPEKPARHSGSNNHNNNNNSHASRKQPTKAPAPATPAADASPPQALSAPAAATAITTSVAPPTAPKGPAASSSASNTAPGAPTAPAGAKYVSTNTASAVSEARLGSGANPRTKLTDTELASKMEMMRILNAEKTRRFEKEQRDETAHAEALAKSQAEQKRRRAEEAVKRRAAEEDQRRLNDERAKNRERKLNAMGQKEGGWDEGKQERLVEEERKSFRGAHGGVRGVRNGGGGLAGSRYANAPDGNDADRRGGDDGSYGGRGRGGRGRGVGRGGRGGGRGGRELFDANGDRAEDRNGDLSNQSWASLREKDNRPRAPPKAEEFPALPSSGNAPKKINTQAAPATTTSANPNPISIAAEIPLSPAIGKWDDEMAAMDAQATS
ncbi:hypothetical protein B0T25DRAFT_249906 [Lasiosphaeria hispida]|uniref:Uncharacterized protein n=1 Tax=Lasiosphaeria hispida TaxID=260671 RepID=A0AAJ0HFV7_9PEZI|nr:hypothetical protein B0T25DRAFT_249906 [Lasiosphaeria hispida]